MNALNIKSNSRWKVTFKREFFEFKGKYESLKVGTTLKANFDYSMKI